jgi:hypothetical protein
VETEQKAEEPKLNCSPEPELGPKAQIAAPPFFYLPKIMVAAEEVLVNCYNFNFIP